MPPLQKQTLQWQMEHFCRTDRKDTATSIGNGQVDSLVNEPELAQTLNCMHDQQAVMLLNDQGGSVMSVELDGNAGTLRANTHGNEQIVCNSVISMHNKQFGACEENLASTLLSTDYKEPQVVCYENHANDNRIKESSDVSPLISSRAGTGGGNLPLVQECHAVAIAENIIGRADQNGGNGIGAQEEIAYTQNATGVMGVCTSTVRRLLPIEYERLMGFPDNWTQIPWKGKPAEDCPDSLRYKACGNSMCVNVMQWIGEQIQKVEEKYNAV